MTADQIKKYAQKLSKLLSRSLSNTQLSDKETKKYTEYSYKDAPRSESHQIVTVGIQHSETLSSFYFKLGATVFKEDFAPLKRKIYRLAKDDENLIIDKTGKQYVMTYHHPIAKTTDRAIGLALKEFYTILDEILSKLLKSNFLNLNNADEKIEKSVKKEKDSKNTKATVNPKNIIKKDIITKVIKFVSYEIFNFNDSIYNHYEYLKKQAKDDDVSFFIKKKSVHNKNDSLVFYGYKLDIRIFAICFLSAFDLKCSNGTDFIDKSNNISKAIKGETVEFETNEDLIHRYLILKYENLDLRNDYRKCLDESKTLLRKSENLKENTPKEKAMEHKWKCIISADILHEHVAGYVDDYYTLTFEITTDNLPKQPSNGLLKSSLKVFLQAIRSYGYNTYDIYYKPKSPINKIFRIDRLNWDGKPYEFKCEKFKNIMIVSVEKDNS
jgi:hypothetical protein